MGSEMCIRDRMWIPPDEFGIEPSYQELPIDAELDSGRLVTVASGLPRHRDHARGSAWTATLFKEIEEGRRPGPRIPNRVRRATVPHRSRQLCTESLTPSYSGNPKHHKGGRP